MRLNEDHAVCVRVHMVRIATTLGLEYLDSGPDLTLHHGLVGLLTYGVDFSLD